jgi:hypothetical protein
MAERGRGARTKGEHVDKAKWIRRRSRRSRGKVIGM